MNSIEMHAQISRFFIPKAQNQQEHSDTQWCSLKDIFIDTIDNINNKIPENLALKLTITLGKILIANFVLLKKLQSYINENKCPFVKTRGSYENEKWPKRLPRCAHTPQGGGF